MKVLFDYQIFLAQSHGGISRYFCNLIKEIKKDKSFETALPINHHDNFYLKNEPEVFEKIHNKNQISEKISTLFRSKSDKNLKIAKNEILKGDFDVFHPTYYADYFLNNLPTNKPFVITIHDMIYELFPEMFSLKDETVKLKKELTLRADKIVVVSEKTKSDLLKFFDLREDKISLIYQPCSLDVDLIKNTKTSKNIPSKFLLFVGSRGVYKNFYFMLYAIAKILKNDPDLHLVCYGNAFNKKEIGFIKNLGLDKKVSVVGGGDEELIALYKQAIAFISPSYYEGFGVTILESFACGCPVLAANASATPEAAGDAALYFDPKDPHSIRSSVEKIIGDQNLRDELVKKGYKQNEKFSWKKTAAEMKNLYQSMI